MMALFIWMMGMLAIGSQAAKPSISFSPSAPASCNPFNVTVRGTNNTIPTNLTMNFLPLGGIPPPPVQIPHYYIGNDRVQLAVSSLPLAPDTSFIAFIGGLGQDMTPVSDIMIVGQGNNNCAMASTNGSKLFTVDGEDDGVLQTCGVMNVSWVDPVQKPPTIRLLHPGGPIVTLTQNGFPGPNSLVYDMGKKSGQIVLFLDDGQGHMQVSSIFRASDGCPTSPPSMKDKMSDKEKKSKNQPSGVVIGAAIAGGIVLIMGVAMLLYFLRERRKRRKQPTPIPEKIRPAEGFTEAFVRNPPYTMEGYDSPIKSEYAPRTSYASWAQKIPDDQRWPQTTNDRDAGNNKVAHSRSSSVESLDVEALLNLATHQSNRGSSRTSEPTPFGPSFPDLPPAVHQRPDSASKSSVPLIVVDNSFVEDDRAVHHPLPGLPRSPRMRTRV